MLDDLAIAFLERSDGHHPLYRRLFSDPPRLVTSSLVIAEGHGWFLRRYDIRRAQEFLHFFESLPELIICPFGRDQVAEAREVLARFGDLWLTLADAHGRAVMSQLRTRECWSTDPHLGFTGVRLVN